MPNVCAQQRGDTIRGGVAAINSRLVCCSTLLYRTRAERAQHDFERDAELFVFRDEACGIFP